MAFMYTYIYMYMYIYVYVYICIYMYIYVLRSALDTGKCDAHTMRTRTHIKIYVDTCKHIRVMTYTM